MITRLAHVCIVSNDLAATERFYCHALGLRKVFRYLQGGDIAGFYIEVSEKIFIEVFRNDAVPSDTGGTVRHICFEVSDIDAVIRRLRQCGYEVSDKNLAIDKTWQAWAADPSGVKIEFHEYTPESPQVTGKDCVLQ